MQAGKAPQRHAFQARSENWRLACGPEAIERNIRAEAERLGARRAFILSSRSVAQKTRTVARIEEALGSILAGRFTEIDADSTYASVLEATRAARAEGADLLVAAGGGSVIVATRAVNVFLCEDADPFLLMTRYPEGQPAYSPRLDAKKLPIINVPVTPTTAMNRAGTGLKNDSLDHRMEYFDPKTRPRSIIWDWDALLATPAEIVQATATTAFTRSFAGVASGDLNPIAEADREHILRLAVRSYPKIMAQPQELEPRLDLFAAALLSNRADDDGAARETTVGPFSGNYAVSTALHVRYPAVSQGAATSVLTATVARCSEPPSLDAAMRVATALGVWRPEMSAKEATIAFADAIERAYEEAGMPTRVRQLGIPEADLPLVARDSIKNFNANRGERSEARQLAEARELLEAAW